MPKFETLPIRHPSVHTAHLPIHELPELVHLDDPAAMSMIDFFNTHLQVIDPHRTMDEAIQELKATHINILFVKTPNNALLGIAGPENLLSEKPITLIQEKRMARQNVTIDMLMTPTEKLIAFDLETVNIARVGNIVKTLKAHHVRYALVYDRDDTVCGLFSMAQISKQLHQDADSL